MSQKEYLVLADLYENIESGTVWISDDQISLRSTVRITNPTTNLSVFVEALRIDSNFVEEYNSRPKTVSLEQHGLYFVASSWYRTKLGIPKTKKAFPLLVKVNPCFGTVRASLDHPQSAVRVSMILGIIGLVLGLVGLVLGILPLATS